MSEERNEHEKEIRKNCCIDGSELCHWLDKKGCLECYIATIKSNEEKETALARWKVTLSYLPSDFDEMHLGDKCVFCIDEPREVTSYALFDMANPEPLSEKGMFFGIGKKVSTPIGSLVTVQAGACDRCKKAYRTADIFQIFVPLALIALAIILLTIPAFATPMNNLFAFLPLIFVILMGVVGYFFGKQLSRNHLKKASAKVKFDLSLIPQIKQMLNKNWFFFQSNDGMPRLSFSKRKQYKSLMKIKEKITSTNEIKTSYNDDINNDSTLDNCNI